MTAISPAQALINLLRQLESVIERLDVIQYRAERARGISGSVGSHIRHTLDHVSALLAGLANGRVDYDARHRDTPVESQPPAALAEIQRLAHGLSSVRAETLARTLTMTSFFADGTELIIATTVARELDFVVSHTIHHCAVMALLLRELGVGVPERFGYAPSTPLPALDARCA